MTRRQFATLNEGLAAFRVPSENHALIRRITDRIGIVGYFEGSEHIEAVRADGGRSLHIAWGWTSGFRSRDEIEEATDDMRSLFGADDVWESKRVGLLGVSHPINKIRWDGNGEGGERQRDYGVCHECHSTRAVNGTCMCG